MKTLLRQACERSEVSRFLAPFHVATELEVPDQGISASSPPLSTAVAREPGRRGDDGVEVARHVDLDAVVAPARSARSADRAVGSRGEQLTSRRAAAPSWSPLAAGKAFSFGYPEHAELLRASGAAPSWSSTRSSIGCPRERRRGTLPPDGFPEQFTAELSANDVVRRQVNEVAAAGSPVHAECAGLIYLASEQKPGTRCAECTAGSARFTRTVPGWRIATPVASVADSWLYCVRPAVGLDTNSTEPQSRCQHGLHQPGMGVHRATRWTPCKNGVVHAGVRVYPARPAAVPVNPQ